MSLAARVTLLDAAYHGNTADIIAVHQSTPNLDSITTSQALINAAARGHDACIATLAICFSNIDPDFSDPRLALLEAAANGHASCIITLHNTFPHINVNVQNNDGVTALIHAAKNGHVDCIRVLGECFSPQIDVDLCDVKNRTAIMAACFYRHANCVRALHEIALNRIDINCVDSLGRTALMSAAGASSDCVIALYDCFPNIKVDVRDRFGHSALMHACIRRKACCIYALAKCFPTIVAHNPESKQNPLLTAQKTQDVASIYALFTCFPSLCQSKWFYSALTGDIDMMHQYLNSTPHANVNTTDFPGGNTALTLAAAQGHADFITALHQAFPTGIKHAKRALCLAARYGHADCIIALYSCFSDSITLVLTYDVLVEALHHKKVKCIAAMHRCFASTWESKTERQIISALRCLKHYPTCFPILSQSFPTMMFDPILFTYAVRRCHPERIRILKPYFPDFTANEQDEFGKTILMTAALHASAGILEALVSAFPDINPNIQDNDGRTALMMAAGARRQDFIPTLLKHFPSIDPNLRDRGGKTALMHAITAAMKSEYGCVQDLCSNCPDLDLLRSCGRGWTPLMYAVQNSFSPGIITVLLSHILAHI